MRRWFVGFQAAASILLLVTAALFARGASTMARIDLGFDADKLITVTPAFPRAGFSTAETDAYWRRALDAIRALPGVERVSLAMSPPFGGSVSVISLDRDGGAYVVYENRTDAGYFDTAGLRIIRGRAYTAAEAAGHAPVALISESVVRDFYQGREPIGSSLGNVFRDLSGVTIIGVVNEALTDQIRAHGNGTIYRPIEPSMLASPRLVIRSARAKTSGHDIDRALTVMDPRVRPDVRLMRDDVEKALTENRVLAELSGSVALVAVALAILGIYGVTRFVVGQRTHEVGVRMAIGASQRQIVRMLVRESLMPVVAGLTCGLTVALLAGKLLSSVLSGVSPHDPVSIASAVLLLVTSAIAAVLSPARRASRTDPASVLRQ